MTSTYDLKDFLNVRFSLRNLSDEDFEVACKQLAPQLERYDYNALYPETKLKKDWNNLCKFISHEQSINSTVRHGMKISEHFMPNFYEIKDQKNRTFKGQWTEKNLEKVLRWNRKSHSTPYLSEIKRGVYFCTGMTKNTMFRPSLAKLITDKLAPTGYVLDPCAGWGGRMMGCVAGGARYVGFEPNTTTYTNLLKIVEFLDIKDRVSLYNDCAENIDKYDFPKVDLILTSPPYYNLEVYCDESTQSYKNNQTYSEWSDAFLQPTIKSCINRGKDSVVSAWNVADFGKIHMIDDVKQIHERIGFKECDMFYVSSSKRPSNQNETKNQKSTDWTVCYKKA